MTPGHRTVQEGLSMVSCREGITKSKHVLYWILFTPNFRPWGLCQVIYIYIVSCSGKSIMRFTPSLTSFPAHCCFWNSSNVGLIDDGPFSPETEREGWKTKNQASKTFAQSGNVEGWTEHLQVIGVGERWVCNGLRLPTNGAEYKKRLGRGVWNSRSPTRLDPSVDKATLEYPSCHKPVTFCLPLWRYLLCDKTVPAKPRGTVVFFHRDRQSSHRDVESSNEILQNTRRTRIKRSRNVHFAVYLCTHTFRFYV